MQEVRTLIQRANLAISCGMDDEAIDLLKLAYQKYLFVFRFLCDDTKVRFRESEFDVHLLSTIEKLVNKKVEKLNER